MTDYTKNTNFTAKDSLPSGNPSKVIKGSEFDSEFDEIATSIASKADSASGTLTSPDIDKIVDGNGNEVVIFGETASAVNEVTITNAATGNAPSISPTGDDTNIDLELSGKGTGKPSATDIKLDTITAKTTNGDLDLQRNGTGAITIDTVPIYGLVILDEPVLLVSGDTNVNSWQTVDMSVVYAAAATAGATKAIITLKSACGATTTSLDCTGSIRKNGATGTYSQICASRSTDTTSQALAIRMTGQGTINLDSNSDFQWYVASPGTGSTDVILNGYYV